MTTLQRTTVASALSLRGVVKAYGDVRAVDGLDLEVEAGTCLGLLGPNGAGKSTTMKLLTGQAIADAGTIEVLGLPVPAQSKQARALMGVAPQADNLDEELTTRQVLEIFSRLYAVPRAERAAAVDRALELATLSDRAGSRVGALSGGMRRRLLIARALVHRPRLVLLDEPTVGLDPQVRSELWSLVARLRDEGVTVLMSTHYIEEAERLADSVAVMAAGRVVARGVPAELVAQHVGREALEVLAPAATLAEVGRRAAGLGLPTRRTGPSLSVLRAEGVSAETLGAGGGDVALRRREAVLEDVFVVLTGEEVA
ncbi:MAG TPA: ABC transporter ATP-binding protein [Mycobacteriales bacterium]|nr:ABC transporter ATP-binding protein [Mycobacteriales bacterium]